MNTTGEKVYSAVKGRAPGLTRHIMKSTWTALVWAVGLFLLTAPLEELFKIGALLWFILYMGIGVTYLVSRRSGRKIRGLEYTPNTFSYIWMATLVITIPLIHVLAPLVYMALQPFKYFLKNFFG